ncbi:hypothetical protein C7B76_24155 [filamentous cyanobacterium CCP2]|nr:hypothetical protein C7B76_24155 [filamentous cyanobacterium CCP2]
MFTKEELQSLDNEALVNIVLQHQEEFNSTTEPQNLPSPSPQAPAHGRSPHVRSTSPFPKAFKSIPLGLALVGSIVLHGLVLLLPTASPPEEEAVSTELIIPMTELPPRSPDPLPQPSVAASPTPEPSPPQRSPSPEPPAVVQPPPLQVEPSPVQPSPQAEQPVRSEEPEEPEVVEEPEEPEEPEELEELTPPTPADIAGVPLDSAWQVLEQPVEQGVNDAEWYAGSEGEVREGIRGLVEIPESNFEEFFAGYRQQLAEAGFNIRQEGSYQGTPIFRLTSPSAEGSLFITLETLEEDDRILMAVWDKYPW